MRTVVAEVVAAVIVIACTVASVAVVSYIYRRETHRVPRAKTLGLVALWFLATYAVTTYIVTVR